MPDTTTSEPVTDAQVNALVGELAGRVRRTLAPDGPSPASVLEWLATHPPELVLRTITATQPKTWAVAMTPLVESLTEDQRIGILAALVAVWVQAL